MKELILFHWAGLWKLLLGIFLGLQCSTLVDGQCYTVDPLVLDFYTALKISQNGTFESATLCSDECQQQKFAYAALQEASYCFCGNDITGFVLGSACTFTCVDGSACGGEDITGEMTIIAVAAVAAGGSINMETTVNTETVLVQATVTVAVNASASYTVDWGDGSTPTINDTDHIYALPGYYYVTAYLESSKAHTSSMYIRVHDSPKFILDCPKMLQLNIPKQCGVTSYRQGYDYTISWNMTNATHVVPHVAQVPAEQIGVFGSASVATDTLADSAIAIGTLVVVHNSQNQLGAVLVRIKGTFLATGSIAVYAIIPDCTAGSFCGVSGYCSASCLSANAPLSCTAEFCSLSTICKDTCTAVADPQSTYKAVKITIIEVTATDFDYDLEVPADVPVAVALAIGCATAADCPSGQATLKTRPLGIVEESEQHFVIASNTFTTFNGRHIAQLVIRSDQQMNLNFTILCTEAAPYPKSDVPTPYGPTTEQYVYKGSLSLEYTIYSDLAPSLQKEDRPGICQEEILPPVLAELWIVYGVIYQNYPVTFTQGSSLYTLIGYGDGNLLYDYMDYASNGFVLLLTLDYANEGLFLIEGNTTNAIGSVLYNATIHVVPSVTNTWTAAFTCPCLDHEQGFPLTVNFPSAAHPPWNSTFNVTYNNGAASLFSELIDFGTYGAGGTAAPLTISKTTVMYLKGGFYTMKIFLQNEVSNTTIYVNVTVEEALRNVTGTCMWDNQGTIVEGAGTNKNIFIQNKTVHIFPNSLTGTPDKWRLVIVETGETFEKPATENFTYTWQTEGPFTLIISGYNSIQGWVSSDPIKIEIVNQIKGYSLTDDLVIRKPNETKVVTADFIQFTPMSCVLIDYGDGTPWELFGDKTICEKQYSDLNTNPDLKYMGNTGYNAPLAMPHNYTMQGVYNIKSKAWDNKDNTEFAELSVIIGDVPCTMPTVQIVDGVKVIDSTAVPQIQVTFHKEFDTNVDFNCTGKIAFQRFWTIVEVNPSTGESTRSVLVENVLVSWNVAAIVLPPKFLSAGMYKLRFTIDILPENSDFHLIRDDYTYLLVTPSPLAPIIISGSAYKVKRGYQQFVVLEPGLSYDPDEPDNKVMNKTVWCRQVIPTDDGPFPPTPSAGTLRAKVNEHEIPDPAILYGAGCFGKGLGVILLPSYVSYQMDTLSLTEMVGTYEFLLEVQKDTRSSSTTLTVEVVLDPLPIMDIQCATGLCTQTVEGLFFNPSTRLALLGSCLDDCGVELSYVWSIRAKNGDPVSIVSGCVAGGSTSIQMESPDCDEAFLTPSNQSSIALAPWFFANNSAIDEFIFTITGITERDYQGSTEILLKRNKPPVPGTCTLTGSGSTYTSTCIDPNWVDPEGMGLNTYSYYYYDKGVKKTITSTVKSVIDLTLPLGNYTLFVDISDVLGAYTTFELGPISIATGTINTIDWVDLAAKDTKALWMALMQYPSIRDTAAELSLDPNDIANANLTDEQIMERIAKIADMNNLALDLLLNTSSFATMGEINAGASILQGIMEGIFKNELGAQTIDMHGRETFLQILKKMTDQVPHVGNTAPEDLEPFMSNILDVMSAGIIGINKNLAELTDCPPTDMRVAGNLEYDGDVQPDTYVPLDEEEMYCKNVKDTIKYKSKEQIDQMFGMLDNMVNEVLKLAVVGETFRANAPNGASLIVTKIREKILENGLTITAAQNMNAETQFPKNFCPSRCIMPNTDCNQVLGLKIMIWPCITHVYPDTSNVLSNSTSVIDVDVIINEEKVDVVNQTSNIIVKIPRREASKQEPMVVNSSSEINNLTLFVYHTFNVSNADSSFTMEVVPETPIDNKFVLLIDFERMPTPSRYWLLRQIATDFRRNVSSNSYTYFVGSIENKNRTGRFFVAFAMLKEPYNTNKNLTKDDFKESFALTYKFRVYSSGCYYFDALKVDWSARGLVVEATTPELITCATNHLTPFGFGYVPSPNMIDFEYVFAHTGFIDNLTLYLVLIIIGCLYILFMICAYFQDRRDLKYRGVVPLLDNDPQDKYLYELTFYTGPDKEATTDSNIYIILSGECEETEVRRLPPAENKLYRRFGVDSFVMATPRPLGSLLYLRVFHDNSGEPPLDGWQLQMVVVRDLQLKEKYIFDTNTWLAFYRGEGQLDKTFTPYEGRDDKSFSQNLYIRSNKSANQDHMWLSIFVRPIGSRFSRKERVSVAFAFLFLSMLVDALWYDSTKESSRNGSFDLGPFSFSLERLLTAACIVVIVFPIAYILTLIFKRARPRNLKRCRALDAIEHQRKAHYEVDGNDISDEDSRIKVEIDESKERTAKDKTTTRCIPWWTRIIAWIVILGSIGASAFLVWSFGIMWGEIKTVKWFSSFILAFFVSILFTQWLKVAFHGLLSTCFKEDLSAEDVDCDEELPGLKMNEEWQHPKYMDPTYRKRVHRVIGVDIENPETAAIQLRMQKEYEIKYVLKGIFLYAFFLAIVMILANGRTDYNALLLKEHFVNTFIADNDLEHQFIDMIKSSNDWWMWAKHSVVQKLRAQRYYNGDPPYGMRGFLDDKVNRIMGYAIIRQIRSKRYNCDVSSPMNTVIDHCSGTRGLLNEESQSYCAGWIFNESFPGACDWEEFHYKTAAELGTYSYTGRLGAYSGGGYIIRLSGNQDDIIKRLDELQRSNWVDKNTRAIILEFSVYNANVNLFCMCMVLAEYNEGGGIVPKWRFDGLRLIKDTGFKGFITTIGEIAFVVATVFFTIRELWEIKKLKMKYFDSYWNIAELCIISISYAAIGLYIYRYILTKQALDKFNATNGNGYVRMDSAAFIDTIFSYLCAAIVFFSTLKLIKLLQFNNKMNVLALTIRRCWDDLKIFFIAFGIIFFAFSCLFFFMFTAFLEEFARLLTTIQTTFAMMLGKFDFQAMKEVNFFSPLLFFVFSVINAMIMVNMMLTIILQAFNEVKSELAKKDNRLNVIDYVFTSFKRFIRQENLPKIHVEPNFTDRAEKLSDRPLDDKNTEVLPDKVSMLLKYINEMYFDGRLDLNDPYAKRTLMGGPAPKMLPFHDPNTFGQRKINNSEDQ